MNNNLFKIFLFVIIFVFSVIDHAGGKDIPSILVGLHAKLSSVTISATSSFRVKDTTGKKERVFSGKKNYRVVKSKKGLQFDTVPFGRKIAITPLDKGLLKVNGRRYRGRIILIRNNDGSIKVINKIFLEDYVRGILKHEISPAWPPEALKVQAVVSRTYAIKNKERHLKEGFNLCAKTHCQVYGGVESEDKRIDHAVRKTQGLTLTYKGRLAQTVFFSNCGGYTENAAHVWEVNTAPAYLRGRRCSFCKKAPRYQWEEHISHMRIVSALSAYGVKSPLKSIKVVSRFPSGRAEKISVRHAQGKKVFNANKLRMIISPNRMRSTLITSIKRKKGNVPFFLFKGRGWGHGVGLCQWGTKGMAERGYNFKRILRFYYPGTKVKVRY